MQQPAVIVEGLAQRTVFLNGRRNSGCSLGLVWQRVAVFLWVFQRRWALRLEAAMLPDCAAFE